MNLVQYMMKKSEERGEERGIKIGEERGVKIGEQKNVLSAIEWLRHKFSGISNSDLIKEISDMFQLDESEAEKYLALSLQS